MREGREWLARLLWPRVEGSPAVARAKALAGAAFLAAHQGDFENALPLGDECLGIIQSLGGGAPIGEDWAPPLEAPAKWDVAYSLQFLGIAHALQGDDRRSLTLFQASLRLFRELGHKALSAYVLSGVGWATVMLGQAEQGIAWLEESVAGCREIGQKWCLADSLWSLGHIVRLYGDVERARAILAECLTLSIEVGYRWGTDASVRELAAVAAARGQAQAAARLWGAAEILFEVGGFVIGGAYDPQYDQDVASIRARLGDDAFAAAWAEGRAMTLEQAVAYARESAAGEGRTIP